MSEFSVIYSFAHKHKCPCGHVWDHNKLLITDFDKAHTCPKCKREGICNVYSGEEASMETNNG